MLHPFRSAQHFAITAAPAIMKSAGVDLAGVESRPTGFSVMDEDLSCSACILHNDTEILDHVADAGVSVVAIDAPLALPRGRQSLEVRNNVHLRECDRELLRMKIKFFPLTLGPMRQLTQRGMRLKAALEQRGLQVIETYPGAAQDILGIPRKGKGLDKLSAGLRGAGVSCPDRPMTGDELDAVTCALVGVLYLQGNHLAIGDPDELLMILPKLRA